MNPISSARMHAWMWEGYCSPNFYSLLRPGISIPQNRGDDDGDDDGDCGGGGACGDDNGSGGSDDGDDDIILLHILHSCC